MQKNTNYFTIMTPTLFSGFLRTEAILKNLEGRVRYDKLDELPWTDSGIYISKSSLQLSDQIFLTTQMEKAASTDVIWKSYVNVYPANVVIDSAIKCFKQHSEFSHRQSKIVRVQDSVQASSYAPL